MGTKDMVPKTLRDILKVVRFKKTFMAHGEVWFEAGDLALMLNQDLVSTCGNVGWCLLPKNTEGWYGNTFLGYLFEEHAYIEDIDMDPLQHASAPGVVEFLRSRLTGLIDDVKRMELQFYTAAKAVSILNAALEEMPQTGEVKP